MLGYPPPHQGILGYAQRAGGIQPTRMQSCSVFMIRLGLITGNDLAPAKLFLLFDSLVITFFESQKQKAVVDPAREEDAQVFFVLNFSSLTLLNI